MTPFKKHEKLLIKLIKREHSLYNTLKILKLEDQEGSPFGFSYFEIIWLLLGLPEINDIPKNFDSDEFTNSYFDLVSDYSSDKMMKTLHLWDKKFSKFCLSYEPNLSIITKFMISDQEINKALKFLNISDQSPLFGLIEDFDLYLDLFNPKDSEDFSAELFKLLESSQNPKNFIKKWLKK